MLPVAWQGETATIKLFVGLTAGLFVAKGLLSFCVILFHNKIIAQDQADMSSRMLRGYMSLPYAHHLQRNSSDSVHRVNKSVETVFGVVLHHAASLLTNVMMACAVLAVLIVANPIITISVAVFLGVWVFGVSRATRSFFDRWGRRADYLERGRQRALWEGLGAVREIKVLGRESYFNDAYEDCQNGLVRFSYLGATMGAVPRLAIEAIFVITMLAAIVMMLGGAGAASALVPLLGLYAYAGLRLLPSANGMLDSLNQIRSATWPLARLIADYEKTCRSEGALMALPAKLSFDDRIVLSNVSFSYEGAGKQAVTDIHLDIRRGQSVGIVGPTGAGKSTLLHLIAGLMPPSTGTVKIDGKNLRSHEQAWLAKLGYVPQVGYLSDDTLANNIAFGLHADEIDQGRLRRAIKAAQLEEFTDSLPKGLNTLVGEHGVRLSGGERQRLAIARALYHEPEVLLFDEATSELDNRTEQQVSKAIDRLRGQKTLVVIAHRLTSVMGCDVLVFMEDGHIRATGTYEQLMLNSAGFRAIAGAAGLEFAAAEEPAKAAAPPTRSERKRAARRARAADRAAREAEQRIGPGEEVDGDEDTEGNEDIAADKATEAAATAELVAAAQFADGNR